MRQKLYIVRYISKFLFYSSFSPTPSLSFPLSLSSSPPASADFSPVIRDFFSFSHCIFDMDGLLNWIDVLVSDHTNMVPLYRVVIMSLVRSCKFWISSGQTRNWALLSFSFPSDIIKDKKNNEENWVCYHVSYSKIITIWTAQRTEEAATCQHRATTRWHQQSDSLSLLERFEVWSRV